MGLKALHPVIGCQWRRSRRSPSPLSGLPDVQDGFQVVGGGGLSLGPGETHHLQPPGWMAVAQVGQQGQGPSQISEPQAGEAGSWDRWSRQRRGRPPFPGGLQIFLPKMGAPYRNRVPGTTFREAGDRATRVLRSRPSGTGAYQEALLLQQDRYSPSGRMRSDIQGYLRRVRGMGRVICCGSDAGLVAGLYRPLRQNGHCVYKKVEGDAAWQKRIIQYRPILHSRSLGRSDPGGQRRTFPGRPACLP